MQAWNGRWLEAAGLVLVRQRSGSAKGAIFVTIKDETGTANLMIWPQVFEKFRPVGMGAGMIAVRGRIQREGEVVHPVAHRLTARALWGSITLVLYAGFCSRMIPKHGIQTSERPPVGGLIY